MYKKPVPMITFVHTLRFRLLMLVLLALVPAAVLAWLTGIAERERAAAQAQGHALQLAQTAAVNQADLVKSTHQLLVILSQVPVVRDQIEGACSAFLADMLRQYPRYTVILVINRDGISTCNSKPMNERLDESQDPFFHRVLQAREFAVNEFRISPGTRKNTLAFGYPLVNDQGQVGGIVLAALDLAWLEQITAQSRLPAGSTLTVYDRNATIVARYPDSGAWIGRSFPDAPIARIIFSQLHEGTAETVGEDNVSRLYGFAPLGGVPSKDAFVSVGIPTSVAYAEADEILTHNLIALGIVAALSIAAAWVGSDWFLLRQMRQLQNVTNRLADGDLSARASFHSGVGELRQLGRAFDKMGLALEQREAARKEAEDQLQRWNVDLQALFNAVAQAISHSLDVNEIADIALEKTLSVMNLQAGCIFLKQGERVITIAQRGLDELGANRAAGLNRSDETAFQVMTLVDSETVQSVPADAFPRSLAFTGSTIATWITVPVRSKGELFGIMCLAGGKDRSLEPHEKGVLGAVGQQIGVAIENAALYEQVQSIATIKERERLSRELHDGLAQVLGYLCIQAHVAESLLLGGDAGPAATKVQEIQNLAREAYTDVRESVLGLRMTSAPGNGWVSALQEHVHKFSLQTGIEVQFDSNGADHSECPQDVQLQLHRIIHEALSNVRKHSEAQQARVSIEQQGELIRVAIEDQGKGFDLNFVNQDNRQHLGLQTMRERAESVAGKLQVTSQPGCGTRVLLTVNLASERKKCSPTTSSGFS